MSSHAQLAFDRHVKPHDRKRPHISTRFIRRRLCVRLAPNKRLKLAGGDRFKGNGALCAGAHELSFNYIARGGRVARSLSAIR